MGNSSIFLIFIKNQDFTLHSVPKSTITQTGLHFSLTFNIFNRCQAESVRPAKLSAENVKPSTQQDLFPQLFSIRDSLRSFLWYSLSSSWFDTNEWFALLGVWRRLTQRWSTSPRPVVVWWNFVLVLFKISCIV